jgi:hypothetical protein
MMLLVLAISILLIVFGTGLGLVSITFNKSVNGFVGATESVTITDIDGILANPTIPAAQPAVLTTHTTNTTGTLTMTNTSHGITTGQRIDLYWTGGQCYGAIAGTVSGTTVPIASVSGGSNLPASSTAVTVGIATSGGFLVTGNNISALVMSSPSNLGYFIFNASGTDEYAVLCTSGFCPGWKTGDPGANPLLTYSITQVYMSHNNTTAPVTNMFAAAVTH